MAVFAAALSGGCSDAVQEATTTTPATTTPKPTSPVEYTSGEATVTTTGGTAQELTFDAPLEEGAYDPADEMELEYRADDGKGLLITWEAGQTPEADDSFVRIDYSAGTEGWFPDAGHTRCTVTVDRFTGEDVAGEIKCVDLLGGVEQSIGEAKVRFSAHI